MAKQPLKNQTAGVETGTDQEPRPPQQKQPATTAVKAQAPKPIEFTAQNMAGHWDLQNKHARDQRLTALARQFPDVRCLIEENAALREKLNQGEKP
jgi:hypothetical protein